MKARNSQKSQDELGHALRELPRAAASIGFRHRVLHRLDEERLRRVTWRPLAVAAVAVIVLAIPAGVWVKQSRDQARSRARVEQLRQEYRSLEQDLLDLQDAPRDRIADAGDDQLKAALETTAEALGGLAGAFADFVEGDEEAWDC